METRRRAQAEEFLSALNGHEVHVAALALEAQELRTELRAKNSCIRALEIHARNLEVHREDAIQALMNSTSWRVTVPLRYVRHLQQRAFLFCKQAALIEYLYAPLLWSAKSLHGLFRFAAPQFRNTNTYRNWDAARADELRSHEFPPEVARPIELDHSVAVPFGYRGPITPPRLAVLCHIFHENMAHEFRRYFKNIPLPFDLFITTDTAAKKSIIKESFKDWLLGAVEIRVTPNLGRDIAPKLLGFPEVYNTYEYVLHVHSKFSDHAGVLATWRGFLLENMLGSPEIVNSVFTAFSRRPDVGIIASQHFEPVRHWIDWGGNFKIADGLAKKIGLTLSEAKVLDFPSGSMFWARSAALKPLLALGMTFDDFEGECDQTDRTLAHAIERLYYYVCERAGFRWIKIAHPPLFEHTPAIVPVANEEELDRFVVDYSLALSGPDLPKPRKERLTPVIKPACALIARLQDRVLGYGQEIDPATSVAIGIVTYNNTEMQIRRVVGSARRSLEQAGLLSAARVLILDNGAPSDGVRPDEITTTLPSVGNIGFGAGHNRLMADAFANGASIYITAKPDGAFQPGTVVALVQMMLAHDGRALIEAIQFPDEHPKVYDPYTLETPWASGACVAIPRRLYEKLGGFDESFFMYFEDIDLSWRARASGFAVRTCPTALFIRLVTNWQRDREVLRMIFSSGIILARKWGDTDFDAWLKCRLGVLGFEPPDTQPEAVPPEWQRIADFRHQFAFSETRW